MNLQTIGRKGIFTAAIAIAMLVGAAGAMVFKVNPTNAQTTTATQAVAAPAATNSGSSIDNASGGTFKPNEDPAHEAQESPEREAQENAGQRPTVK